MMSSLMMINNLINAFVNSPIEYYLSLTSLVLFYVAANDCLGRTPFASLTSCIVMCIGVGLYSGTWFRAIDIVLGRIFEGLFLFTIPK